MIIYRSCIFSTVNNQLELSLSKLHFSTNEPLLTRCSPVLSVLFIKSTLIFFNDNCKAQLHQTQSADESWSVQTQMYVIYMYTCSSRRVYHVPQKCALLKRDTFKIFSRTTKVLFVMHVYVGQILVSVFNDSWPQGVE